MKTAPVTFLGIQSGFGLMPDFTLWNLTADIPGHPAGSSVSSDTLRAAGFAVPETPRDQPDDAAAVRERRRHAWYATRRSMDSVHPFES